MNTHAYFKIPACGWKVQADAWLHSWFPCKHSKHGMAFQMFWNEGNMEHKNSQTSAHSRRYDRPIGHNVPKEPYKTKWETHVKDKKISLPCCTLRSFSLFMSSQRIKAASFFGSVSWGSKFGLPYESPVDRAMITKSQYPRPTKSRSTSRSWPLSFLPLLVRSFSFLLPAGPSSSRASGESIGFSPQRALTMDLNRVRPNQIGVCADWTQLTYEWFLVFLSLCNKYAD